MVYWPSWTHQEAGFLASSKPNTCASEGCSGALSNGRSMPCLAFSWYHTSPQAHTAIPWCHGMLCSSCHAPHARGWSYHLCHSKYKLVRWLPGAARRLPDGSAMPIDGCGMYVGWLSDRAIPCRSSPSLTGRTRRPPQHCHRAGLSARASLFDPRPRRP